MDRSDIAENLMGFEDVRKYLNAHGIVIGVSTMSMRLSREAKASPDVRLPGQLPRPFKRVSNETFPLWWRKDVDDAIKEMTGGRVVKSGGRKVD